MTTPFRNKLKNFDIVPTVDWLIGLTMTKILLMIGSRYDFLEEHEAYSYTKKEDVKSCAINCEESLAP